MNVRLKIKNLVILNDNIWRRDFGYKENLIIVIQYRYNSGPFITNYTLKLY